MSFKDYIEFGWKLCNIPPGNKGPVGPTAIGWQKRENAITNPDYRFMGAGLLHAWSGTCALDVDKFDVAEKWLAERGVDLRALLAASDSVQISSGREGRYKLLYLLDEPLPSKKLAPYKAFDEIAGKEKQYHGFELRSANANGESVQDVLPPSIHPGTGRPYQWVYGDDLTGDWRRLPKIPSVLHQLWLEEIRVAPQPVGPSLPSGATRADIDALLANYDPDCDYETWLKAGAAVHHETRGAAVGFNAWDSWSAKGAKYPGRAALSEKWRSFRAETPNAVTLGSLRRDAVAGMEQFRVVEPTEAAPKVDEPKTGDAPTGWQLVKGILEPRLVFVTGQDNYFDMASRSDGWLSDRSVRHMFCPLMPEIEVEVEGKNGKSTKKIKPDPVTYLQNSRSKTVVDAVGLNPAAGRIFKEDGSTYVNRYYPQKVELLEPLAHETEAFLFLWSRMKDPIFQRWLMKFYAHALKKPGVKIQTAPLLYSSETGTGKNTIAHVIPQLLFGHRWVRTISGEVLRGQFNDTVGETWWLYLEELRTGANKADRVALTNKLKAWITDSTIEVHPKGLKPYNIRNRLQIIATSNFEDALHLDNNDRRWAVCEMDGPISEQEATDIYHFLRSERAPGVLRYLFNQVDLTGFSPTARAPTTLAKVAMIRAGIGAWESALVERMVAGLPPFHRDVFRMQDAFDAMAGKSGPQSLMALRHVLTHPPFNCRQLPAAREVRLYCWRNFERWKGQPESARIRYLETGQRPGLIPWPEGVPEDIANMSVDGILEKPGCDLI